MPHETDTRLRSFLDGNQPGRERLCVSLLQLDRNYTSVRPRQPRGGPDAGRDIEAHLTDVGLAYGGIGFKNNATDTPAQRTAIKKKFRSDLTAALSASPPPRAFVFFTNVALTISDKDAMQKMTAAAGLPKADIFDRERLRILLDSPDGLSARYQYLNIPLSDAEQKTFFSRWGADINSLIATKFSNLETSIRRMLFLQEATLPLDGLAIIVRLRRSYSAAEMGHFRFFYLIHLKDLNLDITGFLLGVCDGTRDLTRPPEDATSEGLATGISSACWTLTPPTKKGTTSDKLALLSTGNSIGREDVDRIILSLSTSVLFRLLPGLQLRHLDGSMSVAYCNQSLVDKIDTIEVLANTYRLASYASDARHADTSGFSCNLPTTFSTDARHQPWVRIRHAKTSFFPTDFSEFTPQRLTAPEDLP